MRGLVQKGAGIALGWLYDKTLKPAIGYLKGQGFIQDFIYNIFESFGKKMKERGGKEDEEAEKEKAKQQAAKGSYTYNGPASGWRYPLTSKYYGGNWGGHSPDLELSTSRHRMAQPLLQSLMASRAVRLRQGAATETTSSSRTAEVLRVFTLTFPESLRVAR